MPIDVKIESMIAELESQIKTIEISLLEELAESIYPYGCDDECYIDDARTIFIFIALIEMDNDEEVTLSNIKRLAYSANNLKIISSQKTIQGLQPWIATSLAALQTKPHKNILVKCEALLKRSKSRFEKVNKVFEARLRSKTRNIHHYMRKHS